MSIHPSHRLINRASRRVPLRTVLIVPFVLQIFTVVGLVGYLSFRNGQQAVNNLATKLRSEVTARINQHLDTYLTIPQQINQINSDAIELGLLDLNDFQTTGDYFWKQLQVFEQVGYISFGSKEGEFIGAGRYPDGLMEISEMSNATGGKNYTYPTDREGQRLDPPHIDKDYDFQKEAWYADTLSAGKPIWSQIYPWENYPEYVSISHSCPIYDKTNTLIGIISVDLQLSQINQFLGQLKISSSGKTFILERNGLLVASSSAELPYKIVASKAKRFPASESGDRLIQATAAYLLENFRNLKEIESTQQLSFTKGGQRNFVQVTPYGSEFGLNWLIVAVVPESDFMAQINAHTRATIVLCIAALLVATGVGFLTARWVIEPIGRLNMAAKNIANGEWDETIKIDRFDEVGELVESFNDMAAQLQASFTELKSLNEALFESEKRLTQFLEALPVGVSVHDATGKLTYANQTAKQLLGRPSLPVTEVTQSIEVYQIYRAGTKELYPTENFPIMRALAGEKVNVDDLELRQPHKTIPLEVWATPIYAESDQIAYAIAAFQDITERKQAENLLANYNRTLEAQVTQRTNALRRSESHYRAILEDQTELIARFQPDGTLTFVNEAYCRYFGLTREELIGSRYEPIIIEGDREQVARLLNSMHQENPVVVIENRVVVGGQVRWTQWINRALFDESGHIVAYQTVGQDISDRRQAEADLRESEVREREKALQLGQTLKELRLTQAQLIQAEKMSSLGRMVAGVAHEINNPVSFIFGNLVHAKHYFQDLLRLVQLYRRTYPQPTLEIEQLAKEIDVDFLVDDWPKLMNSMQVGVERIHQIVLSLRLFSRLDESEIKCVDIHEGIDNTLLILQHRLKAVGSHPAIEVVKDYGLLPKMTCYASQLNQVFMNLLNNAIDALESHPSSRIITISTDAIAKDPSTPHSQDVIVRIADNGPGISEELQKQIFEPFFTTKPVGSGTGLGLAISYQIVVEKHQGQIHCVSTPGQGTEFIVEIPVR